MFASGFIVKEFDSTRPGSFSSGWGACGIVVVLMGAGGFGIG